MNSAHTLSRALVFDYGFWKIIQSLLLREGIEVPLGDSKAFDNSTSSQSRHFGAWKRIFLCIGHGIAKSSELFSFSVFYKINSVLFTLQEQP